MQVRARPTSRHGREGLATAWCRPWPQREGSERSTRHKEIRRRARCTLSVVTDMTNTTHAITRQVYARSARSIDGHHLGIRSRLRGCCGSARYGAAHGRELPAPRAEEEPSPRCPRHRALTRSGTRSARRHGLVEQLGACTRRRWLVHATSTRADRMQQDAAIRRRTPERRLAVWLEAKPGHRRAVASDERRTSIPAHGRWSTRCLHVPHDDTTPAGAGTQPAAAIPCEWAHLLIV